MNKLLKVNGVDKKVLDHIEKKSYVNNVNKNKGKKRKCSSYIFAIVRQTSV